MRLLLPRNPHLRIRRWLEPGMGVKRWLLLMVLAVAIMGLGIAYLLREFYTTATLPGYFYYITLQFIPRYLRGLLFLCVSVGLFMLAVYRLSHVLVSAVDRTRPGVPLAERIYQHRFGPSGPRIVAIGGGTGLSRLLLGLKNYTDNLTAIVSVGDDGGSSGRLRQEFNVLPPGDVRNCIAALAEADEEMRRLFQHRFEEGSGLEGHSFGNLFIVALSGITGSFEEAVRATSRILAVRGQIFPLTPVDITLGARMADGEMVWGESNITHHGKRIDRLILKPENAHAYPGNGLIDCVLANDNIAHDLPKAWMSDAVALDGEMPGHLPVFRADVVQADKRYHHDSEKLARALMRLYADRAQYALAAAAR
jgi:hypothetical protein